MTNLEKEIGVLFKLCGKTYTAMNRIGADEIYRDLMELKEVSKNVFMLMENHVNTMAIRDYKMVITDRVILSKMLYIILRSIYVVSKKNNHFFDWDARCKGSAELAQRIFSDNKIDEKLDNMPLWMKNDMIYEQAIIVELCKVHKTLLQNMVRCLTNSLTLDEYKQQRTNEYLSKFESCVLYYLTQAPDGKRVYLDYI